MAKVGIFFGSDEGNTQAIAERIAERFVAHDAVIHDIADVTQLDFDAYDFIVLGISTWDFGQIQSDWEEFWPDAQAMRYDGKKVALFGLGDQFGYGDFFVDAMGMLHDIVKERGAHIVGHWPITGYEFDASKALAPDGLHFVGLAIDEDQQSEQSDTRIDAWCEQLLRELL
ncbi:flavodoxin [Marinagarivorans algicola]|uniref:flavodoxin n=1 Tax=Marinagarivorans algicola TaxID=1513270 RepID=UPI0006B8B68A|nr:flavodoxin [Marinagarivorans algicola]